MQYLFLHLKYMHMFPLVQLYVVLHSIEQIIFCIIIESAFLFVYLYLSMNYENIVEKHARWHLQVACIVRLKVENQKRFNLH